MRSAASRALDFLTGESMPIRSVLRLALIALIVLLVSVSHVRHWLDAAFEVVLAVYAIAALGWAVFLVRAPYRRWYSWAATAVDVLFVVALCIVSGAATVWLLPVFFLLPIPVVFLDNPVVTAALGLAASAGYLVAWLVYAGREEPIAISGVVYVQVGAMLWLTVALTALAHALRRRAARVQVLLDVRRRLVGELLQADARNSRALSEQLHDGPLQSLLAARFELHRLRTRPDPETIDRVEAALRQSEAALRSAVSTLHPQVLDQAGLTPALRHLIDDHTRRWSVPIDADLDEVGRPAGQAMLYRAARELLVNSVKHACAQHARVRLRRDADGTLALTVADDGIGFDPAVLPERVAEGHIGLASVITGIEAMGGSVLIDTAPGAGTAVAVTLPVRSAGSEHRPGRQLSRQRLDHTVAPDDDLVG